MRFAKKCDVTGDPFNAGYCILDGQMDIKSDLQFLKHITEETEYDSIDEAYDDEYYYWSEWDEDYIDEQGYYYNEKGELIEL